MGSSLNIALVTCQAWPNLSASDQTLADELTARGHRVRALPWNSAPVGEFTSADLVVLRSNWDFHHDLVRFANWLDRVDASAAELHNPADLVRPFLDKSGLRNLGLKTPETLVVNDFDGEPAQKWADDRGFDRVVVKPAWGASGHGVELVTVDRLTAVAQRWQEDPNRRPMLVQEFVPAVEHGETALVFFDGTFSHALLRQAAPGDFRVNSQYGGTMVPFPDVSQALIDFGAKVEVSLPQRPTYVRIDVVSDGINHTVMEVEVNEPALGLDLVPEAAARFAAVLVS